MWNCESKALQLAKVQATLKKHMAFNWKTPAPSITQMPDAPLSRLVIARLQHSKKCLISLTGLDATGQDLNLNGLGDFCK